MKTTIYALLTVALFTLNSCHSEDDVNPIIPKERRDIPLSRTEEEISDKTMAFSRNLIAETLQDEEVRGKNLLVSPLGVSAVLNLLANGAEGNTSTGIYSALSPSGCSAEDLNGFYSKLNAWLPDLDNTTTVAVAYSLWVKNTFSVKSSYTDYVKSTLSSDVFVKDFTNPQATQDLYHWCSEKTNGCIKEIKLNLSDCMLALVNALYFKGSWANKFESTQTKEENFYGTMRISKIPMMYKDNISVKYAESNGFTAISLPYGNEAYSMMIVLPPEGCDLSQAGKTLTEDVWSDLFDMRIGLQVGLKLPKFELAYEASYVEILKKLNIIDAFSANANFSRISDASIYCNKFGQKAFLRVDEMGTEAAAVTYTDMDGMSIGGDEAKLQTIVFNRPFFFFICEKSTGLILFMGKVEDL